MLNSKVCENCISKRSSKIIEPYAIEKFEDVWKTCRDILCYDDCEKCCDYQRCLKGISPGPDSYDYDYPDCVSRFNVFDEIPEDCPYELEHKISMKQVDPKIIIDKLIEEYKI